MTAITVLGAGSYGTALALSIARNGHQVLLWGHEADHIAQMQRERSNEMFLPGIPFPDTLELTADLSEAVQAAGLLLVVVPSFAFGEMMGRIKPYLRADSRLAWATKGLDPQEGRLLGEVAREVLGQQIPLAVLSGPTFAKEMAAGMPTAIACSDTDGKLSLDVANLLHNEKNLRVYQSDDFIGMQLGGAVKNVIAIGAGISDGVGFGANARTALITRGLTEMARLGEKLGAKPHTFMGMSGLGDLVLTCTDNQSRNRRFGLALGQGKGAQEAMDEIGQVVEGYRNAHEVKMLADRLGVEMPITEQIYAVLYKGKSAKDAAKALLSRGRKVE